MKYNLSEITELIRERRTIYPKFFSDRKVHKEQIELILNNAVWAPTHKLSQPWRFKVFMNEGKESLANFLGNLYKEKTSKENFNPDKTKNYIHRSIKSSAVIAVCMARDPEERLPEIEEIAAVSCAIQNMFLTTTAYGLGAFWATPKIIYTQEMNTFLNLKEKDKCIGLFYIGYPEKNWPKSRRKPIEYVTDWIEK